MTESGFFGRDYDDDDPTLGDPEFPAGLPRHGQWGHAKIRRKGDPTRFDYFRRASALGDSGENPWAIERRNKRLLVWSMGRWQSLVDQAAAVTHWDHGGRLDGVTDPIMIETVTAAINADKAELDRIIKALHERAGGDDAAEAGTALHSYGERHQAGEDLSHIGPRMHAAMLRWLELLRVFEVHSMEGFVVCDELEAAGSYDYLLSPRIPLPLPNGKVIEPGERIIGDSKTGKHDINTVGYLCQQPVYCHGGPYDWTVTDAQAREGDDGRRDWPDGIAPRDDVALIVHVPLEHPEDAGVWAIDTHVGAQAGRMAQEIRATQKRMRGMAQRAFRPVELPALEEVVTPPADTPVALPVRPDAAWAAERDDDGELVQLVLLAIAAAPDRAALERIFRNWETEWSPDLTEAAARRLAELGLS